MSREEFKAKLKAIHCRDQLRATITDEMQDYLLGLLQHDDPLGFFLAIDEDPDKFFTMGRAAIAFALIEIFSPTPDKG